MLASVRSATLAGVDGQVVTVEVHVSPGCPAITSSGCPTPRSASRTSGSGPRCCRRTSSGPRPRITVNLAPGGVRKTGAGLRARGRARRHARRRASCRQGVLDGIGVLGELGLDGAVRPVPGVLALVDALGRGRRRGRSSCPTATPPRRARARRRRARRRGRSASSARASRAKPMAGRHRQPPPHRRRRARRRRRAARPRRRARPRRTPGARSRPPPPAATTCCSPGRPAPARRCSPAGCHDPRRRSTPDEALEVTRIHSAAGRPLRARGLVERAPVPRAAPHGVDRRARRRRQSAGSRPGEVTLAHRGVLFLDELGEFPPHALDALRQPLEERVVRIARQAMSLAFPADFQLVACSNPCPCGRGGPTLRVHRAAAGALPAPPVGAAARPLRPPPRGARARARRRAGRAVGAPCASASPRRSHASSARYADWPWRRNAHIPAGALARLVPLDATTPTTRGGGLIDAPRGSPGAARRGPPGRAHARRPRRHRRRHATPTCSRPRSSARTCRDRGDRPRLGPQR